MSWVVLVSCAICVWWMAAHGWPWIEAKVAEAVAWHRRTREIARTVTQEVADLDAEIDRVMREGDGV